MRIIRWYTMIFWLDCFVSLITTVWFAVTWFVYTDHSLPELADDPEKLAEHDRVFRMESQVSIAVLVVLRLVHVSFVLVARRHVKLISRHSFILRSLSLATTRPSTESAIQRYLQKILTLKTQLWEEALSLHPSQHKIKIQHFPRRHK